MTTGSSIFLIALGAVLKFGVTASFSGISLSTIGVILMIVGAIGLVLSLVWLSRREERVVPVAAPRRERIVEREPLV